ncbi:hypothetical protein PENTCL1PPCAC_16514, partial [Pristionchus entomophagus]
RVVVEPTGELVSIIFRQVHLHSGGSFRDDGMHQKGRANHPRFLCLEMLLLFGELIEDRPHRRMAVLCVITEGGVPVGEECVSLP